MPSPQLGWSHCVKPRALTNHSQIRGLSEVTLTWTHMHASTHQHKQSERFPLRPHLRVPIYCSLCHSVRTSVFFSVRGFSHRTHSLFCLRTLRSRLFSTTQLCMVTLHTKLMFYIELTTKKTVLLRVHHFRKDAICSLTVILYLTKKYWRRISRKYYSIIQYVYYCSETLRCLYFHHVWLMRTRSVKQYHHPALCGKCRCFGPHSHQGAPKLPL